MSVTKFSDTFSDYDRYPIDIYNYCWKVSLRIVKVRKMKKIILLISLCLISFLSAEILIPMDLMQTDHLKAYGIAFSALKEELTVQWLLNYRGGSYLNSRFL